MNFNGLKFLLSTFLAIAISTWFEGYNVMIAGIVAFFAVYLSVTLVLWLFIIAVAVIGRAKEGDRVSSFYGFVMNTALASICSHVGIRIRVKGKEKIPICPYLLVCNHRSNFDNMVLSAALTDSRLVFISKPENFKIPFAGAMMRKCNYLSIDRENPRNAIKTVNKAADMLKNTNARIGVFPEGTRGNAPGVAEFSEGCFLVAKKAHCPIVVATVSGTERVRKRFPLPTTVYVDILGVISSETVEECRSGELSASAHEIMASNLLVK